MPATVFGQDATKYLDAKLLTIFMTDTGDWVICNDLDDALAPTEDSPSKTAISMSVGTASFIDSLDDVETNSAGTILEIPSPEDTAEINRYFVLFRILLS